MSKEIVERLTLVYTSGEPVKPNCDFCYSDHHPQWRAELELHDMRMAWSFQICDHCRLLLRDVISVVLHKLTHAQVVEALVHKMDELGITHDDLMGIPRQPQIEERKL